MRKRENEAGDSIVATECEAFLNGTLAEYWDEKGVIVPVWAWTNLLAHGSEGIIGESVVRPSRLAGGPELAHRSLVPRLPGPRRTRTPSSRCRISKRPS